MPQKIQQKNLDIIIMDVKKTVEFYLPHYEIIWPVWGALARVPINAPIILESCLNEKHSAKEKKILVKQTTKHFHNLQWRGWDRTPRLQTFR